MVRVAYVKHNREAEYTEYLCPDKKINSGDIVYLQGMEGPYFIEDIQNIPNKDLKATYKVKGLAVFNPDVTTTSRYMNIINVKGTCLVNSLGIHTHKFGNICKAIVEAAKSSDIDKMLNEHPEAKFFDTFITDG